MSLLSPLRMQPYRDLNGDSGVEAYEAGTGYIKVRFRGGSVYTYTHASAGPGHIEEMKRLAHRGDGLNAYINRNVRDGYAAIE